MHPAEPERIDGTLAIAGDAVQELLTRQKAEADTHTLEHQLDLREKFYALVSHDLRNPLTAARAQAELIRRYPDSVEMHLRSATAIIGALDRANRMIADLLDANQLGQGHELPVKPAPCELREIVRQALDDTAHLHHGRARLLGESPVPVSVDAAAIRRAIENLVSNAIKYGSSTDPILVRIEAEGPEVCISVNNRGPVIAPEEMTAIFQWHGRSRSARESGKAGWGLGLMLVQGIARAHAGRVSVMSTPEAGTTFAIRIPRNRS